MLNHKSKIPHQDARAVTFDHVIPKSQNHAPKVHEGVVAACAYCNGLKADKPYEQAVTEIRAMVDAGEHPHQIFERTGIWAARAIARRWVIKHINQGDCHGQA